MPTMASISSSILFFVLEIETDPEGTSPNDIETPRALVPLSKRQFLSPLDATTPCCPKTLLAADKSTVFQPKQSPVHTTCKSMAATTSKMFCEHLKVNKVITTFFYACALLLPWPPLPQSFNSPSVRDAGLKRRSNMGTGEWAPSA